jgi:enediyne polyketide synthase
LVPGALADWGARSAAPTPGCQAHHADWPAWSGEAVGERADLADAMARAGYAAMPVSEGSRLLLKALATDGLPNRLAIHGRVGVPAPRAITTAGTAGRTPGDGASAERFIERVLVYYPGVELIAEARLSLLADPYLLDYQADGVPVLPPTMALEAMAQAASVLAGGALVRQASKVTMRAPIVLPAGLPASQTVIRIYALRDGDAVTISVRSDNSGFAVDHCRATFSLAGTACDDPPPLLGGDGGGTELAAAELYGNVLFQAGRFKLLTGVSLTGPRTASGVTGPAGAADEPPWFGAIPPARAATDAQRLVLGDAALSDAALQVVQASVADRRMLFAGCDSVVFSEAFCAGKTAGVPATILAGQAEPGAVPRQRGGPAEPAGSVSASSVSASSGSAGSGSASSGSGGQASGPAWHILVTGSDGQPLISWNGLRMRDAGPLHQPRQEAKLREATLREATLRDAKRQEAMPPEVTRLATAD